MTCPPLLNLTCCRNVQCHHPSPYKTISYTQHNTKGGSRRNSNIVITSHISPSLGHSHSKALPHCSMGKRLQSKEKMWYERFAHSLLHTKYTRIVCTYRHTDKEQLLPCWVVHNFCTFSLRCSFLDYYLGLYFHHNIVCLPLSSSGIIHVPGGPLWENFIQNPCPRIWEVLCKNKNKKNSLHQKPPFYCYY